MGRRDPIAVQYCDHLLNAGVRRALAVRAEDVGALRPETDPAAALPRHAILAAKAGGVRVPSGSDGRGWRGVVGHHSRPCSGN